MNKSDINIDIVKTSSQALEKLEKHMIKVKKEIRGLEERNGELEAELGPPYCSKKEAAFHKALGFKG